MEVKDVNLQELVLGGQDIEVALFIVCTHCMGVGTYEQKFEGGPYGFDRVYHENCGRCYQERGQATGKQMVKTSLDNLAKIIRGASG